MTTRPFDARRWAGYAALFIGFFIAFRWYPHLMLVDRVLGTDLDFYLGTWALEPNSLVVGRLAQNSVGGIFSETGSLGLDGAYTRQFGLATWLLTLPAYAIAGFSATGVGIMVSLVCVLSAVLAAAATVWIGRGLGRGPAVAMAIVLLLPWSVAIGRSMYWTIGVKLLPAVLLILVMRSSRRSWPRVIGVSLIFSALAALSGYEYFSIVGASQLAVVAGFAVFEQWPIGKSIRGALAIAFGALGGFAIALGLHLLQLYVRSGDMSRIDELLRSALSRTGAGTVTNAADVTAMSPAGVLDLYFGYPVLGVGDSLPVLRQFTMAAFVLVTAVVIISGLARAAQSPRIRREQALGVAWFVSLLGPLGWFLLARPHSVMHTFMNVSLWFLPTVPLGAALVWTRVQRGLGGLRRQPAAFAWLIVTALALIAAFAYSYLAWRRGS